MTVTLKSFMSHINPNPNLSLKRGSNPLSNPLTSSFRFEALLRPRSHRVSVVARCVCPKGLGNRFLLLDRRRSKNCLAVSFAASNEDSHSEIEIEKEKSKLEVGAVESEEAWKQMLESFNEHTIKMKEMSQEAYELYSKKAVVILKESLEQVKIQAEKARHDLGIVAKEVSEEGKDYLSTAAENSPEEVKDIVETFVSSTDELNEVSRVRDFYLGIPYGALLTLGGFLSFVLTGNISAIRFGVILGGTLLALSVSSLRSWKRRESSTLALKGQAAIASIIFLRELRVLSQKASFPSFFMTLISGAMGAFYLYRIMLDGDQKKGPSLQHGPEK